MTKKLKNVLVVDCFTERVNFFIEMFGNHHLDVTENFRDAIFYLLSNVYDYIFLGGELGQGNGSGYDVARFLVSKPENPNNQSKIIIHSWNMLEAEGIKSLLPSAAFVPFNEAIYSTLRL